jgi:demethylmenaquinone methyltransferase/2-methoxy-6-polyprenyl-1,4-benzoquinol methylase
VVHVHAKSFFSKIAGNYDMLNQMLSLGLDKALIKEAVEESRITGVSMANVLDVATGTGNVAIAIAKKYHNYNITGLDISSEMLKVAAKKSEGIKKIKYVLGDIERLDMPSNSFDIVVSAFSLSTFNDPAHALEEMHRVLKPGGKIILLDMLKITDATLKRLMKIYYSLSVIPALDSNVRNDVEKYIQNKFEVDKKSTINMLQIIGFRDIHSKELSVGLAFIVSARK